MHRPRLRLVGLALTLALLAPLFLAAPQAAAGPSEPLMTQMSVVSPDVMLSANVRSDAKGTFMTIDPDERLSLLITLSGPRLWDVYKANQVAAKQTGAAPMSASSLESQSAAMVRRQAVSKRAIEALGATVVDSYQVTLNGFLVHATRRQVAEIAKVGGVERVERAPILKPDLDKSIPWIGAPKVWQDLGFDGKGTIVAVIDTGVDYTHAALGGSGLADDFANNDEEMIEPGTFPTTKVVGGYDLAGTLYTPACPPNVIPGVQCTPNPVPDDDPIDTLEQAHGSHVSGIVASMGGGDVAKGAAPGASLVMVKVFGNPVGVGASTDLANSAIEWVTKHNLGMKVPGTQPDGKINVINMSLGSGYGTEMGAANRAISAAVEAGVTVIASAGNSGDNLFITGSPAAADMAVSVASSTSGGQTGLSVKISYDQGGLKTDEAGGQEGAATFLPTRLDASGPITAELAYYGLACNDTAGGPSAPEQDVKEKVALIERGVCPFYDKVINAEKKGAIAVVVYSDAARSITPMGCGAPSPCTQAPQIPGVMIMNNVGLKWRDIARAVTTTVVIDSKKMVDIPELADTVSDFSSRGPARFSGGIKPQITAPGSNIMSIMAGSGTKAVSFSGTSMASPTVAGIAALLWQRNIDKKLNLSAADIGALAMNYSKMSIKNLNAVTGPVVGVPRQGAGRIDAFGSAKGGTLVRSETGVSELGFAEVHFTDASPEISRKLIVKNLSAAAKTYKPDFAFVFPADIAATGIVGDKDQGVSFTFTPPMLTVPAGGTGTLDVNLVIDPAKVREWNLNSYATLQVANLAAYTRLEVDGQVNLTEVDGSGAPVMNGDKAGVPFYVLPRRHACVDSADLSDIMLDAKDATADHTLRNPCKTPGDVEIYRLVGSDPAESATLAGWPSKVDITDVGMRHDQVNTDPNDPNQGEEMIEWTIKTAGNARTPFDTQYQIMIDSDKDGTYDHVIFNAYGPNLPLTQPLPAGTFWAVALPLVPGSLQVNWPQQVRLFGEAYEMDGNTVRFLVPAETIGADFSTGKASFDFGVLVTDGANDYDINAKFLGYDFAPDSSEPNAQAKPGGDTFTYDQEVDACLLVAQDVTTPNADKWDAVGTKITLPANGQGKFTIKRTCDGMAGEKTGLLLRYSSLSQLGTVYAYNHNNMPDMISQVRKIQLGKLAPEGIYIPFISNGYQVPGYEPAPPIDVTAMPIDPTPMPTQPTNLRLR